MIEKVGDIAADDARFSPPNPPRYVKRVVWIMLLLLWVLCGLLIQISSFWWLAKAQKFAVIAASSRGLLWLLNLDVQLLPNTAISAADSDPQSVYVLAANHISWLDIFVLLAHFPVVFVAKKEIASWPVLGWLVRLAGTVFIDRNSAHGLRAANTAIESALRRGQSVAFFPEGTTSDGSGVLPIKAGLLQNAINAKVSVLPVHLSYRESDLLSRAVPYIGEMTLLTNVWQLLDTRGATVQLHLGELIAAADSRRALAQQCTEALTR